MLAMRSFRSDRIRSQQIEEDEQPCPADDELAYNATQKALASLHRMWFWSASVNHPVQK